MATLRERVEAILDRESNATGVSIVKDGKLLASRDPLPGAGAVIVYLDAGLPSHPLGRPTAPAPPTNPGT